VRLDRIPAGQREAVRPGRIQRNAREPLVERVHAGIVFLGR
jgi:hypothetical protein